MKVKITVLFLALLNLTSTAFSSEEWEDSVEPYGSRMLLLSRSGARAVPQPDPLGEFGAYLSELEKLCISARIVDAAEDRSSVEALKTETFDGIKATIRKMAPTLEAIRTIRYLADKVKDFETSYKQYKTQISIMIESGGFGSCVEDLIRSAKEIRKVS